MSVVLSERTGGSGCKLKYKEFQLNRENAFFTLRGVKHWHRLPKRGSGVSTGDIWNLTECGHEQPALGDAALSRRVELHHLPKVPSHLNYSVIMWCSDTMDLLSWMRNACCAGKRKWFHLQNPLDGSHCIQFTSALTANVLFSDKRSHTSYSHILCPK